MIETVPAPKAVERLSWQREPGGRSRTKRHIAQWGPYRCVVEPGPHAGGDYRLRVLKAMGDDPEVLLAEGSYVSLPSAKAAARRFVVRDHEGKLVAARPGPAQMLQVRWSASTADSDWEDVPQGPEGTCRRVYFVDEDPPEGHVRRAEALVTPIGPGDQLATVVDEGSWRYEIRITYRSEGRELTGFVLGGVALADWVARAAATQRAHRFLHRPDVRQLRWVAEAVGFEPTIQGLPGLRCSRPLHSAAMRRLQFGEDNASGIRFGADPACRRQEIERNQDVGIDGALAR